MGARQPWKRTRCPTSHTLKRRICECSTAVRTANQREPELWPGEDSLGPSSQGCTQAPLPHGAPGRGSREDRSACPCSAPARVPGVTPVYTQREVRLWAGGAGVTASGSEAGPGRLCTGECAVHRVPEAGRGWAPGEASDPRPFPSAVGLEVLRHQPVPHGPALHVAVLRAYGDCAHVQVPTAAAPSAASPGGHFVCSETPSFGCS